jgi:hypothetical protein
MATNLYISLCKAQCDSFPASAIFPRLVAARRVSVSETKSVLKRQGFTSAQEFTAEATRALPDVSKKWFLGMLANALRTLAKFYHCPREIL